MKFHILGLDRRLEPDYKLVRFIGSSRRGLSEFPELAKKEAGKQLWKLQKGQMPDEWKQMPSIGAGAMEIIIHQPHEHRVITVAKFSDMIYVIHVFEKKSQKTPRNDYQIARRNYAQIAVDRKKEKDRTNL